MKNLCFASLTAVAVGMVGGCTSPSTGIEGGKQAVVLQNFTMFDGTGAAPVENQALVIVDDRIVWVGPSTELDAPDGATVEDLNGQFVMPGLIDNHVHLGLDEGQENYSVESIEKQLKLYSCLVLV